MSPEAMRATEALLRHGEYLIEGHQHGPDPADPDALEWLQREAEDVAALIARDGTADELVALLADTAWFDPTTESDARARRVAADLGLAS